MLLEAFAVAAPVACKRDSIVSPAFTLRGHSLTTAVHDWTQCREATGHQLAIGPRINARMLPMSSRQLQLMTQPFWPPTMGL